MNNRTVKEIIEKAVRDNGFDGLYNSHIECACTLKDGLQPCDGYQPICVMGYEVEGVGEFEGTFMVQWNKPYKEDKK